jgi:hypothetical protein
VLTIEGKISDAAIKESRGSDSFDVQDAKIFERHFQSLSECQGMGCTETKLKPPNGGDGAIGEIPRGPKQPTLSNTEVTIHLPAEGGQDKKNESCAKNQDTTESIPSKRPSFLSLSNSENSFTDITVSIPDPFRSSYKVTDSLYHKNYRKLYRGIDKNRRDVLVEFTDLRAYERAGYSQVDFFNRIDIIRDLSHPSIPKVLDIFDGSEVNRVVFDYFPGKDLDCLLKMKGAVPPVVSLSFPPALRSLT